MHIIVATYIPHTVLLTCFRICLNDNFLRRLVNAWPAIPKHNDRMNKAVAAHTPRAASNPAQKGAFFSAVARSVNIFK